MGVLYIQYLLLSTSEVSFKFRTFSYFLYFFFLQCSTKTFEILEHICTSWGLTTLNATNEMSNKMLYLEKNHKISASRFLFSIETRFPKLRIHNRVIEYWFDISSWIIFLFDRKIGLWIKIDDQKLVYHWVSASSNSVYV